MTDENKPVDPTADEETPQEPIEESGSEDAAGSTAPVKGATGTAGRRTAAVAIPASTSRDGASDGAASHVRPTTGLATAAS